MPETVGKTTSTVGPDAIHWRIITYPTIISAAKGTAQMAQRQPA